MFNCDSKRKFFILVPIVLLFMSAVLFRCVVQDVDLEAARTILNVGMGLVASALVASFGVVARILSQTKEIKAPVMVIGAFISILTGMLVH